MKLPTKSLLGITAAAVALAGCGLGPFAPLRNNGGDRYRTHSGIPVSPGAPDMGQQPLVPQDPSVVGQRVKLSVLYTSDMHSRIEPFADDYYHKTYAGKGGFARLATRIKELKRLNPNTVLLDSGDYLVGTPYFNYFRGEAEMKAMNLLGFDAITIGNHEFDGGVDTLRKALTNYQGRRISTNIAFEPELAQRYAVIKAGNIRVGVFGLLTDVNGLVTPPNFAGARYYDPIEAARAAVAKLEKEADVIVAISHVGTIPPWTDEESIPEAHDPHSELTEAEEGGGISDEKIAAAVPGLDVILSGHTHLMIKRPKVVASGGKRCHIVSAGYGGGFLGKFDIDLLDGEVVGANNNLIAVDRTVAPDPQVQAVVEPYRAHLEPIIKETIGMASGDFRRYASRDVESSLNNLVADATLDAARKVNSKVDFAISSSGTPRNHILSGPITVEDVFYATPWDNRIEIVTVKGSVAKEMLRIQRRAKENKRHAVSNVTYTLIPASGGKQRIQDVKVGGQPFDESRTYLVAVTDYMAEGGGGFSMLPGQPRQSSGVIQRDGLIAYIRASGTLKPATGRIKLRSKADAVVAWVVESLSTPFRMLDPAYADFAI